MDKYLQSGGDHGGSSALSPGENKKELVRVKVEEEEEVGNCVMSSTMGLYLGIWLFEVGISCSFLLRSRGRVRDFRSPLIP
ncbi:hypothetical protein LguiA_007047 [Lonicera macranthoides]